ncbi:MAG: hypothetical protein ACQ9MH_06565 [Nitrospinales bacterium]
MTSKTSVNLGNLLNQSTWTFFAAPSLLLFAPLIVFICYHDLSFSSPEILLIMFGMLLFGLAFGLIIKRFGSIGQLLVLTCLLELSLDLIIDFELIGKIVCAITAFLFSWIFREKAPKILTLVFSIFIISVLAFPSKQLSPTLEHNETISSENDLPPVIHLILDGHIGVEGLPENLDQGRRSKKDIISFYANNGFHLYGNAYSHFDKTLNSVSSLLNFVEMAGAEKGFVRKTQVETFNHEMVKNKYFKKMSGLGYKIKVYQSVALNYCQENFRVESCYTYQTFSTQYLKTLSLDVGSNILTILSSYLFRSEFFRSGKNIYWHFANYSQQWFGWELPYPWKWNARQTSPIGAVQGLEKLKNDIRSSSGGTLFFAHLLMPHAPFIYDSNCQLYKNPITEWLESGNPALNYVENTSSSRINRYIRYIEQIDCLNIHLQDLFNTMRSANIYKNATIIIHGDHGSRIRVTRPINETSNKISSEDLLDSYSTLFAVKSSQNNPIYNPSVLSIDQIFSMIIGKLSNEENAIEPETPYVYLKIENPDKNIKGSFIKWPYSVSN